MTIFSVENNKFQKILFFYMNIKLQNLINFLFSINSTILKFKNTYLKNFISNILSSLFV